MCGTFLAGVLGSFFVEFDPRSGATTNFTSDSASLPYGGFPLNSSATTRDGEILLGGIDCLMTFFPDQIATRAETPLVVISRFLLDNKPAVIGDGSPLATSINEMSAVVLEVISASGRITSSRRAKMRRLSARSSVAASITTSTPASSRRARRSNTSCT